MDETAKSEMTEDDLANDVHLECRNKMKFEVCVQELYKTQGAPSKNEDSLAVS